MEKRFEDGEFWKVSEGTSFTMGELEMGHHLGPGFLSPFLRMSPVRRPDGFGAEGPERRMLPFSSEPQVSGLAVGQVCLEGALGSSSLFGGLYQVFTSPPAQSHCPKRRRSCPHGMPSPGIKVCSRRCVCPGWAPVNRAPSGQVLGSLWSQYSSAGPQLLHSPAQTLVSEAGGTSVYNSGSLVCLAGGPSWLGSGASCLGVSSEGISPPATLSCL